MGSSNLDDLRPLCRDQAAFQRLQQLLAERELLYQQFATQVAQQLQDHQALMTQQQSAEAASRAKSQFLAMMSHELRTPLNAILGLSSLLIQEMVGPLTPKQAEYLDCIHASGDHLLALINDILDLSKVEAGQEHLRLAEVDVPALCHTCIAMVKPRVAAKPITLSCRVAEAVRVCVADEQRLRQMLLNLLSNAIKFTHQGQVTLTVQPVGGMVQFEVADTGIGIAADQRSRLFQPFTQLDSDLNRRYDGTGLGLALTQQLAQLHGGYVTVESEKNQGSRFSLYLPVDGRPSRSPRRSDTTSISPPSLVLLDPDPNRPHPWVAYLQLCGWQVSRYAHWTDLRPILRHQPPHVLVLLAQDNAVTLATDLQSLSTPPPKVILLGETDPLPAPMAPLAAVADLTLALPLTVPKLERLLALGPAQGWDHPI